jgi:hypothetical protein
MKKYIYLFIVIISSLSAFAQTRVSGVIKTSNGKTIPGVNITLVNTYDGASTDTAGRFAFTTTETGAHVLHYVTVGFKPDSIAVNLDGKPLNLSLTIKEAVNELNAVTITAGTIETGDAKKGAVLSSIDIATTAGAVADIVAALQTLPGTSQAFSENGLFVRGGSAAETRTYFDGMLVKSPFSSQLPDISSRSRFSPFLFKGTTFSSGGYSAQYGQALSSALILETKDLAEKTSTEFSVLTVGVGAAHTERFENSSLTVGGVYYNLSPTYSVFKQNINWDQAPIEKTGNIQYKWKPSKTSMLKIFSQYSNNDVSLFTDNPDSAGVIHVIDHNKNSYTNITYQDYLNADWRIQAGASYSNTHESGELDSNNFRKNDHLLQGRFTLIRYMGQRSLLRAGAEAYQNGALEGWNDQSRSFNDNLQAAFTEGEIFLSDNLVMRLGGRAEHSSYLADWNLAPRTSLAVKTGTHSQVSMAYGIFYQNPDDTYLLQSRQLGYEKATHYLLNYQYLTSGLTFRVEAFYKQYADLTKYNYDGFPKTYAVNNYSNLFNGGDGYAKGIDVFWRDKQSIPGGDYYISYSYLDTKRNFRNYPIQTTPPFAAKHTLNVVYKQYIPAIKSELSTAYAFSSGRTYYNPNNPDFLSDKTKAYNNLSMNLSYLTRFFKQFAVVYLSVNNIPGFNNIYGYNYPSNGSNREPIYPAAKRNYLFGLLVTIGDNTFNH